MKQFATPFLGRLPASEQSIPFRFIVCGAHYSQEDLLIEFLAQYPYRSVQIVLRLYSSPAEVLAGFDVDAPCCAYDGDRVWASPRAIVSMMRQSNTVDMTRRSPSYEIRLAKYSSRGFEVYIPGLKRGEIDPTVGRCHLLYRAILIYSNRSMSVPLDASKGSPAYLLSRNSLLMKLEPSTNSSAVSYVVGRNRIVDA
jgi:hypothetical protein